MALTDDQISRLGYRQALTTNSSLPADDINIGLIYIPLARNLMEDRSTYLTATDAPDVADLAIIEFVRLTLLGLQPETDVRFTTMKMRWMQSASISRQQEDIVASDCYPDPLFNKIRKRLRNFSVRENTCPD